MKTQLLNNVKVIYKGTKESEQGFLKLAITRNKKIKVISLKIKCWKKDFNSTTGRLRSTAENYKDLNEQIELKFKNYINLGNSKIISTFSAFITDKIVKSAKASSTKRLYEAYNKLLQKFLDEKYGIDDIKFENIDTDFVIEFEKFLTSRQKNRSSSLILSTIHTFYTKADKKYNIYKIEFDPFYITKYVKPETNKSFLSLTQLKQLILYNTTDFRTNKHNKLKYNIFDVKNAFLFCCFTGLRVSDIITLRFSNFQINNEEKIKDMTISIKKLMIKTKKYVNCSLNSDILRYLERQIDRMFELGAVYDTGVYNMIQEKQNKRQELKELFEYEYEHYSTEEDETIDLKEYIEDYTKQQIKITSQIAEFTQLLINNLSCNEKSKNQFVFPFLNSEIFKDVDEYFRNLNPEQILAFQNGRGACNRLIKEIGKQCHLNLHFHLARHTFTNLLLSTDIIGLNIYDLQQSLGHTSINSTEQYIGSFKNNKIKSHLDNLMNKILI